MQRIKIFLSVAKHLNFTKAANELFITQPAVTYQISSLEMEWDVQLFERDNKGVRLTVAGKYLYEALSGLYYQYEKVLSDARAIANEANQPLRVGYLGYQEQVLLPSLVQNYQLAFPNGQVHLVNSTISQLCPLVLNGELDIAFVSETMQEGYHGLHSRHIFDGDMVLAVSSQHPLATKTSIRPEELAGEKLIVFGSYSNKKEISRTYDFLLQQHITPLRALLVENCESGLSMAASGLGVFIMARARNIRGNELFEKSYPSVKIVDLDPPLATIRFYLVWHKEARRPEVADFIHSVTNFFLPV